MFMRIGSLAAISIGLLSAANSAQAATTWVCNVFSGPKHFINKGLKAWGREVDKATKGEVKVRFLATSAAPPPKQIDGIVAGTYDCAFIFHAFTAKRAIGPQFAVLPFINEGNAEQGSVAFWRTWNKHFGPKKEFEDDGIKVLSMFHFGGVHFFTARSSPINSIADMKKQKMWALAGTPSRTMIAAGVSHVSGPAVRVAEFTQTKVVQGLAGLPREAIINFAGVQFPKFGTFTTKSLMMPSFAWMVSMKKWNALSADLQKTIMAVSGEKLARRIGQDADAEENEAMRRLAKVGMKEVKATAAFEKELRAAANPQIDAWMTRVKSIGVDGAAVLADYAKEVAAIKK